MTICYFHAAEEELLDRETAVKTLAGLLASGQDVVSAGDLCRLAAAGKETFPPAAGDARIVSVYQPRAVRALFVRAGLQPPAAERIFCHAGMCSCGVLTAVLGTEPAIAEDDRAAARRRLDSLEETENAGRRAWYPVLDRDRCTACGQCAGFCLFGVYEISEGGDVIVSNPAGCKDNCPACARVCPAGAVIFPKFPSPPINGGGGDAGEPVRLDPSQLVDGDVMERLRRRSADSPAAAAALEALRKGCDCTGGGPAEKEDRCSP